MTKLDRAAILAAKDTEPVAVHVPEWGGDVYLKPLSAAEFKSLITDSADAPDMVPLLAKSIVDPDTREPIFTAEDVQALRDKSAAVVFRLINKASELNNASDDAPKG